MPVVYQHRRLDNNEVFYVGIGSNRERAYHKASRNRYWKHIVKKVDYSVEILYENLTWKEACQKEQELIKLYGRKDVGEGTLVNRTDGGQGVKRLQHSEEYKDKLKTSGPMSNPEVVSKWKNTIYNRTEVEKQRTKKKILDSVFGKYTEEEIKERYEKMGNRMRGLKRPHTSKTMKGKQKQKVECPNCGIIMSKNHMTRFHKNKCSL